MTKEALERGLELTHEMSNYEDLIMAILSGSIRVEFKSQVYRLDDLPAGCDARDRLADLYRKKLKECQAEFESL